MGSRKFPLAWIQQRGTALWNQGFCDARNDPKYAAEKLSTLRGLEYAGYSMGICDATTSEPKQKVKQARGNKRRKSVPKHGLGKLAREVKEMLR